MPRIVMAVAYLGDQYHGWQCQPNHLSVQTVLEKAIAKVANHEVKVACAGRTDAGVHALMQVIHFDSEANRSEQQWCLGVNALLPNDVVVSWVRFTCDEFHARFSASARQYTYLIDNALQPQMFWLGRAIWQAKPLDHEAMHVAAQHWIGEFDFSSFRGSGCQSSTPMRCVQNFSVQRQGDLLVLQVTANAFLYHMIRNFVGVLLPIGHGKKESNFARWVLMQKNRKLAGVTAPAHGLYLSQVFYPEKFDLSDYGQSLPLGLNV